MPPAFAEEFFSINALIALRAAFTCDIDPDRFAIRIPGLLWDSSCHQQMKKRTLYQERTVPERQTRARCVARFRHHDQSPFLRGRFRSSFGLHSPWIRENKNVGERD